MIFKDRLTDISERGGGYLHSSHRLNLFKGRLTVGHLTLDQRM